MAYSKTPVVQTYETKRVNFIANPQQRSTSKNKDFRLTNMMTEVIQSPIGDQKKYYVKSRPGLTKIYDTQAAVGRGLYYWVVSGTSYAMAAVGNKIYSNGTAVLTLSTSTGQVGFTEFVNSSGVKRYNPDSLSQRVLYPVYIHTNYRRKLPFSAYSNTYLLGWLFVYCKER